MNLGNLRIIHPAKKSRQSSRWRCMASTPLRRKVPAYIKCSHSFGALFSLHEQVVHGDAFLYHTAVLAVGDSIGRDHGQMNGLLAG